MFENNQIDKGEIILNEKVLNFLCEHCGLLSETKDWWLKTIGNDFPIKELENIDGDIKGYITTLKEIINSITFDRKGNIKNFKNKNGSWNYTYDKNNNMIRKKDSKGYKETYEYYEHNNKIGMKTNTDGYYETYEYDEHNNKIRYKISNGYWNNYEYDEYGNLIKFEDSEGHYETYEYDQNNNKIKYEDSSEYSRTYKYDKNNNLISFKDSNEKDEAYKYNINSKIIKIKLFSKGELQEQCSIPLTYRNKNLDNSIEEPKKEQEKVKEFSLPILSF